MIREQLNALLSATKNEIVHLLTEKYLTGEISEGRKPLEDRILQGDLMDRVKVRK